MNFQGTSNPRDGNKTPLPTQLYRLHQRLMPLLMGYPAANIRPQLSSSASGIQLFPKNSIFVHMDEKNRVLIITYYWPPSAGSGVQRWLKFAKYLPEYGWEPVIFTPENPDFELKDESLLQEVSKDTEVLKFPIWEPYDIFRKLKKAPVKDPGKILESKKKSLTDRLAIWLRANLLVPDPRVFWVKPSTDFLLGIIEKNNIKAIITTGPPHSVHLIGRNIKRKSGLPWIADFRDPWSSWEFLDTLPMLQPVRNWHHKLELSVLREANAVVTISPTFKQELETIGKRKVRLITNGFDSSDLPDSLTNLPERDVFHVVYTGIIDAIRNPLPFMQAFKNAFSAGEKKVRLTFVGRVSEQVQQYVQEDPWLRSQVDFPGYLSHKEVFAYYQKASLLLLILTNTKNAKGNIPGKLFEYMATGRKIIALGDPEGDSATIIQEANAGKVFRHEALEDMKTYLQERVTVLSEGEKGNLEAFDRKFLTGKLAQLLNETTDSIS